MNELDALYRALSGYKKQTGESRECGVVRKSVVSSNPEADVLTVTKAVCTVDEDWISAIEEGLKHVEKAIDEGRQFIRSLGDIVPIEQVKRVSKDSVEHLAKHSDFITKEQEDEDLIPDKLYIVERLSDFAVYENRFLYMLLLYLQSFISFRYQKLLELSNTYRGNITINKTVAVNKRKMVFQLKMDEEKRDDEYLKQNNPLLPTLQRIDLLLKTVVYFLSTPLMLEVSRTPVLKPPITKTNVLKMNRNFKGAVALYSFVSAYDKQGFTVENREERISPFPAEVSGEFAEVAMLTSFLTYKHGMGLKKFLEKAYQQEEDRRRAALAEEQRDQLLRLKRRLEEGEGDPAEYIMLLEKQIKVLEIDSKQLAAAGEEIEKLLKQEVDLKENIRLLNAALGEKQVEIDTIDERHLEKLNAVKRQSEKEVWDVKQLFAAEREEINRQCEKQIETNNRECIDKIERLNQSHAAEAERKNNEMLRLEEKTAQAETRYNEKSAEYEKLKDDKALSDARLFALRKENGLIPEGESYTSEAEFKELEHQLEVFVGFLKGEWGKTKKRIRKEILKLKPEKKNQKLAPYEASSDNNKSDY